MYQVGKKRHQVKSKDNWHHQIHAGQGEQGKDEGKNLGKKQLEEDGKRVRSGTATDEMTGTGMGKNRMEGVNEGTETGEGMGLGQGMGLGGDRMEERKGMDGRNGIDGRIEMDGRNRMDGRNGMYGINGMDGINVMDGINGMDGRYGMDEVGRGNGRRKMGRGRNEIGGEKFCGLEGVAA